MPRTVLDIFLSSTSEDLRDYRHKVAEQLERLRAMAVRMETFGARPSKPMDVVKKEVEGADALIVIVGHRYGWIPSKDEGGDGETSVTWWEVRWALESGKPVYAFLLDPKASWQGAREQDRLLDASSPEQAMEVHNAVLGLKRFRAFLDSETTREWFENPDHLAALVGSSLSSWLIERAVEQETKRRGTTVPGGSSGAATPPPTGGTGPKIVDTTPEQQLYFFERLHLQSARRLVPRDAETRVAVIAGVADTSHPALRGISIEQRNATFQETSAEPDDYTTGLVGLIAANSGTFGGIAPHSSLLVLNVFEQEYTSTLAATSSAVDAARLGGAQVICLALGARDMSEISEAAIKDAVQAGVTLVCAAGNSGDETPIYPAALPECIAVASLDENEGRADFSSFGDHVDLAAPGVGILAPTLGGGYRIWNGSSVACAIVTGIVALIMAANPDLTPKDVAMILKRACLPVSGDSAGLGAGRVNAYRAVSAARESRSS